VRTFRFRDPAIVGVLLVLAVNVGTLAVEHCFRLGSVRRTHLESAWTWFIAATLAVPFSASASGS
jgi:hypothetical protein